MKQIIQIYKTGELKIETVPEPALKPGGVLVQTHHSLISAGTEKMKVDDANRSFIGMARAKPDQVKQVIETFKQQGPMATFRKVWNRLDSFTPLGYSLAGRVIAVGKGASDFNVGDMVACAGADLANHAEINWIPVNLCAKIPEVADGVEGDTAGFLPTDQAAFTTVGSIAMQGVRQANVQVGESVAVIGLGLVGLLAVKILKAAGCEVFGIDIDPRKSELAKRIGADATVIVGEADVISSALSFSGGRGMDKVIVASGGKSNEPIITAGEIARDRGTIVNIGINRMDVPWKLYYGKELILKQSRSYGPGRYDPEYEDKGRDYPIGYVRWTEKRNMESFLKLMANGDIDVSPLVTHGFNFDDAKDAYQLLEGRATEFYVGVILKYDVSEENLGKARIRSIGERGVAKTPGQTNIGMIGAGNFARTMLLPHITGEDGVNLSCVATSTGITAKDTARKYNFDRCTTDYKELIDDDSIDTVMVLTRHNLHGPMVAEALTTGKNVYVEKPLAITEESLDVVKSAYEDGDGKLFVGFNRRFAPLVVEMKSFFDKRTEPMVITYRVNAGFKKKSDWYQQIDIGGGRIIGEACHMIDTVQFFTDALPDSVFARAIRTSNVSVTQEDNVIITITLNDGSIASITYLANGDPMFPKEYIEIFCDGKVAVMDNFSSLVTMSNGNMKKQKNFIQDKGHKAEMKRFIESVRDGTEAPISFESLYTTSKVALKTHESLMGNCLVKI